MSFMDINNLTPNERGEVWVGGQLVGFVPPTSRQDLANSLMRQQGYGPNAYNSMEDRGSYDPSIGDTMATGRESISPFSPDTAAFSTSNQTTGDRAFGNFSGNSFGNVGALTPGAMTAAGNAIAQGRSAVSTPSQEDTALTEGLGGKSDKGYVPGTFAPNFDWTFSQPFSPTVPSFPTGVPLPTARPAMPEDQPSLPQITVNKPSAPLPNAPPPGAPPGGGGVSTSAAPSGGGFGGGIDMSATGGYEGSASVGNTTGAAGFTSPGGGSGFGNVGGQVGSYGSYAGEAPSGSTTPGAFAGYGGYDPGSFSAGFAAGAASVGGGDPGGGGMGGLGGGGMGGGGTDPGGSPGGVG